MTENQIKEAISEAFIRLILARDGFKINTPQYDHGIDLNVNPVDEITLPSGEKMLMDSGKILGIQLKCTTCKNVKFTEEFVEYGLRNKNYFELKSKCLSSYTKLILVVFILPDDQTKWMEIVQKHLLIRKHCFWYLPENDIISPTNLLKKKDDEIKIEIPIKNHLLDNFKSIYKMIYGL